jgi:hypothetical protein
VNWIFPEAITQRLLRIISPARHIEGKPKFPAWYDGCLISDSVRESLLGLGFQDVWQVPFFYHGYFKKLPGLYQVDRLLSQLAEKKDWRWLASFAYTIVRK